LQIAAGAGHAFVPFGVDALAFNANRDVADPRLIGPFGNPGTTAGYFTLMTIYWVAELMSAVGRRRRIVQALMLANVAGIVASGNRASFIVLMAGLPALLFYFRRELGPKRFFQYLVGGIAVVILASATIAVYSGFGNMFRRLAVVTETEEGLPTTRAGTWSMAFEKIERHPWLGEGPHYMSPEDAEMMGLSRAQYESLSEVQTAFDPYPHSLYLYLLRTVGIVGLAAMLYFFAQVLLELRRAVRRENISDYPRSMIKAGIVMIGAFLITQITLEFNRTSTMDYAQFILAFAGLMVGVADRSQVTSKVTHPGRQTTPALSWSDGPVSNGTR
jgi:O-antigen ligase